MAAVLRWFAALVLAWALSAPPASAQTVTVFAAASLKDALDDIGKAYEVRTGVKVRVSYAATSAIARQIEQGAPADIFVSADSEWMDYLADRGLIAPASRRDLLRNRLVLIAPANSRTRLRIAPGAPIGPALGRERLALAAAQVPAGKYARAALARLGLWRDVQGCVVDAENVRTALQYVARGEAPLGVVYATDAKIEPRVRVVGVFPEATHPPIVYPAALTTASRSREANRFLAFMASAQAARTFQGYGFTIPRR
ncbi:MAG: molybdate ABC transporter substrate-binding protein [Phenylobacterium sp.]|uniref:molybdate ABC transporter substrate-binding protein n=1 Tax=Phenylobacterium sp. TaxID=1871053 RepID=UPI00391B0C64